MPSPRVPMHILVGLLIAACTSGQGSNTADPIVEPDAPQNSLLSISVLPSATYAEGPASGARVDPAASNGVVVPFTRQPVQGISAMLANDDGTYWALLDNGYGAIENSADFELRVYRVRLNESKTATGSVDVLDHVALRDPDKKIPWTITNTFTTERILTGADLDVESFQASTRRYLVGRRRIRSVHSPFRCNR